jgi:hypothetical protein
MKVKNSPLSQSKGVDEIVEEIKIMSWKWSISRLRMPPCFFYEWN